MTVTQTRKIYLLVYWRGQNSVLIRFSIRWENYIATLNSREVSFLGRGWIFFNIIFCLLCCNSMFQTLSGVNSTSKQVTSNKTPDTSTSSKCHNVHFNNYYSGPANKDIKVHLLKIENQLVNLEKKIDALTENKTTLPGEFLSILYVRLTTHPYWNISC